MTQQHRHSLLDTRRPIEGLRMPAPRRWRGAHRGRRTQTSNGGNRDGGTYDGR